MVTDVQISDVQITTKKWRMVTDVQISGVQIIQIIAIINLYICNLLLLHYRRSGHY